MQIKNTSFLYCVILSIKTEIIQRLLKKLYPIILQHTIYIVQKWLSAQTGCDWEPDSYSVHETWCWDLPYSQLESEGFDDSWAAITLPCSQEALQSWVLMSVKDSVEGSGSISSSGCGRNRIDELAVRLEGTKGKGKASPSDLLSSEQALDDSTHG